jgi:hypothetical protein
MGGAHILAFKKEEFTTEGTEEAKRIKDPVHPGTLGREISRVKPPDR